MAYGNVRDVSHVRQVDLWYVRQYGVESRLTCVQEQLEGALRLLDGTDSLPDVLDIGVWQNRVVDRGTERQPYGDNVTAGGTAYPKMKDLDVTAVTTAIAGMTYEHLEQVLSAFLSRDDPRWLKYLQTRAAVRIPRDDGMGDYTVIPNTFPPYPLDVKEDAPARPVPGGAGAKAGQKSYQLVQFFSDSYVVQKYDLDPKFIRSMQILALSDPASAAMTIRDVVQAQCPDYTVKVCQGEYGLSAARCARTLADMAAAAPTAVEVEARLIGKKLFLFDQCAATPEEARWTVSGPVKNAEALSDAYRIVMQAGLRPAAALFPYEFEKLDITLCDGTEVVSPVFVGNVGTPGSGVGFEAMDEDKCQELVAPRVYEHVMQVAGNLMPVVADKGGTATAVRVSPTSVLVNAHVVESDICYIGGSRLQGGIPVGHDLWCHAVPGHYSAWNVRSARKGERAFLVAHDGTRPVWSEPFMVDNTDGASVVSSLQAGIGRGASGAAVVAVSDGALLAVHCGTIGRRMLSSSVTAAMLVDIQECEQQEMGFLQAREERTERLEEEVVARGKSREMESAAAAVLPLYSADDQIHVGMAVRRGACLTTALQAGEYLVGASSAPAVFEGTGMMAVCCVSEEIVGPEPLVVRPAQMSESVVVIGADGAGPYTSEKSTVRTVAPGGRSFFLGEIKGAKWPLRGGLVIATSDFAVVGQYVRVAQHQNTGPLAMCVGFDTAVDHRDVDYAAELRRVFPVCRPEAWPSGVAQRVFTHPSLQQDDDNRSLAAVGDAVLRLMLTVQCHSEGLTGAERASVFNRLQSNGRLAPLAWEWGLANHLRAAEGNRFDANSKPFADLVEAAIGAVYLSEDFSVFKDCVLGSRLLPSSLRVYMEVT